MAGRGYIVGERAFQELRRLKRKLDTILGPGVTNAPDNISIEPVVPRGRVEEGRRGTPSPAPILDLFRFQRDARITVAGSHSFTIPNNVNDMIAIYSGGGSGGGGGGNDTASNKGGGGGGGAAGTMVCARLIGPMSGLELDISLGGGGSGGGIQANGAVGQPTTVDFVGQDDELFTLPEASGATTHRVGRGATGSRGGESGKFGSGQTLTSTTWLEWGEEVRLIVVGDREISWSAVRLTAPPGLPGSHGNSEEHGVGGIGGWHWLHGMWPGPSGTHGGLGGNGGQPGEDGGDGSLTLLWNWDDVE